MKYLPLANVKVVAAALLLKFKKLNNTGVSKMNTELYIKKD